MHIRWRPILRLLLRATLAFVLGSVVLVLFFRVVPVFGSMVMLEREVSSWFSGEPLDIQQQWRPWDELSDNAKLAVIAAEDQRFPEHNGFDLVELKRAVESARNGGSLRGASTITQQTAKNLFLWTGRDWVRKGFEAWFATLMELLWPKERILEVYLNIVEFDRGVFGLEAASQHYFGVGADQLSAVQAARLAAVLPNPLERSASRPGPRTANRAAWIQRQMNNLGLRYLDKL
ncbi:MULTISPECIES: monofunctional biosynthetic peptidoglycan transglycosylase [Halomonas]|uniref:monofunctional biosynthetic peptidoglycan transglycosylase n=1 Tax=Halomonas TaxID=2745 RepID=UPI001C95D729|nr:MULTISPECIES: monofunctional biosynthetic peptidoglycan transglycosylase [Halomonas]MED5297298.1 monofunctional biosynthetic peptidoglycan transglycosylase [Pseudomonadota bacterium]MBY5924565.1 monofunctional biosynthetic peptidoglycan transglycosylase [Halomonas sp. DP4Y7-2]MBY5929724.1 monofunctional biosynthetic peptidoglycan transglycosylase [Halomonas sp. DP8Y7-3]MBY5968526.1 monofunctional biosynthetic peptidoglycan transglycosylase [Halomonas denitrificans]MBY6028321.1 monofunctiona